MALYFRHPSVRPHQKELMEDMHRAISFGCTFMAHAPTGLGKTDASLAAAISNALEESRTVFFLTPKISQHKIAMDVVRGIAGKYSLPIRAVDMVGRSHCCIDETLAGLDNESFQAACQRKRQKAECQFFGNAKGYGRAQEAKAEAKFKVVLEGYGTGRSHHELIRMGREQLSCPYEWLLKLASASNVIIADYHHIMSPHIRDIFLMKIKKRVEDSIIIVDEAHNLAPRVRSSLSRTVSSFIFARMAKEMRFLGLDAGPVEEEFASWSEGLLGKSRERVVSAVDFEEFIGRFGLGMEEAVARLEQSGEAFVEKTGRKSACLRLARFLAEWNDGADRSCVRILSRRGVNFFLSRKVLDPSVGTAILNQCASAVLMSGSLLPMEMHRDVLGLDRERTVMRSYPSPFDPSSVVNVITENLTTRYSKRDAEGYAAIAGKLDAIVSKTPGGTAVFFPSYEVQNHVLPLMLSRNLHVQRPQMRPHEIRQMLRDFDSGGVLCGVQGGSLSEGVDYADGQIKSVVIVGVALDEMGLESRALIDYYDERFGRGWDYGYLYPGTIKALQAAGRARRKESDRVAIVYMDERFKWSKYSWILSRDERTIVTGAPEAAVEEFWAKSGKIREVS
ncbi:MAG: ATP-dependent DNA helicase [Candidatus Micrarchaeota archaeon]